MQRHVQRDGGLAHAGAPGHQDQFGVVQAEDRPVQIGKAGRHTGDLVARGRSRVHLLKDVLHDLGDRLQPADGTALPQGIDLALRGLELGLRLAGLLIDEIVDLIRRLAQPAQQRTVAHDGRVLQHVCRRWRDAHDLGHVALAVVLVDAAHAHLREHRHRVDRLAVGKHRVDRLVDVAVELDIKFIGFQPLQHIRHALGVDQQRADDRLLRRGGIGYLPAQQFIHSLSLAAVCPPGPTAPERVLYPSTTSTLIAPLTS